VVNVLLIGGRGQVGQAMLERLPETMRIHAPVRAELDLTNPSSIAAALDRRPHVVVNAGAFTAVDRAEDEPEAAFAANRDGVAALARQCAVRGVALIHLSTDYVFDGTKTGAYVESDRPNPMSVYGRSKLEGEEAVRAGLDRHVILRCSWVFGPHGANFVRSILTRAMRGENLRVVNDQRGCPTAAVSLAGAIFAIAQRIAEGRVAWGTYHYVGREPVTWFEFAQAAVDAARPWLPAVPRVDPITTAEFPVRALRPRNSVLDCTLLAERFGIATESWRGPLADSVAAICRNLAAQAQHRA
jgi:dTDP-4-dehydrorhamnose reductase